MLWRERALKWLDFEKKKEKNSKKILFSFVGAQNVLWITCEQVANEQFRILQIACVCKWSNKENERVRIRKKGMKERKREKE